MSLRIKWYRFDFRCSHLDFRYRSCSKPGTAWHSNNFRVNIHSMHVCDMIKMRGSATHVICMMMIMLLMLYVSCPILWISLPTRGAWQPLCSNKNKCLLWLNTFLLSSIVFFFKKSVSWTNGLLKNKPSLVHLKSYSLVIWI